MSVYIVADCHVGNHAAFGGALKAGINNRCQLALDTLARAAAMLTKPHDWLVVAGDLLDRCDATPQVVAAVRALLPKNTIIIPGNHERVTSQPGDHACVGLDPAYVVDEPRVVKLEGQPDGDKAWLVLAPVVSGTPALEVARQALALAHGLDGAKLLVMHAGLEDDGTPPWLRGGGVRVDVLAELCAAAGVGTVVSGDWHPHAEYEVMFGKCRVNFTQVGALCPTGWDNEGLHQYGSVLEWCPRLSLAGLVGVRRHVVPGPRFITVASRDEVPDTWDDGYTIYSRIKGAKPSPGDQAAGIVALPEAAASPPLPAGAAVEDAVVAWINGQPQDAGVKNEAAALARRFLEGAC